VFGCFGWRWGGENGQEKQMRRDHKTDKRRHEGCDVQKGSEKSPGKPPLENP